MNSIKIIGAALIILALGLGYTGLQESQSVASQVSEAVTGTGTDRSISLLIGAAVSFVVGLLLLLKRP
jgi:hypothetical protein